MNGGDLIASSLRLINVLASGETPSGAESTDALMILNQMLDTWNADRLMIYTIKIDEFPLTVGKQTYTMGASGDFNTSRPARIERMGIVSLNNPVQPLELPLEMLTDTGWAAIPVKIIQSSLPQKVYDDGAFPLRNLNFWCIPSVAVNVRIYSWSALSQFADLITDYTFPPGYLRALRYNLAMDLAPEFGVTAPASVAETARQAKAAIESINAPLIESHCETALVGSGGKRIYNWLTDQPSPTGR